MLAPMQPELQPIVEQLGLSDISGGDRTLYRGTAGDVEVIAMLTLIGMPPAEQATRRMLQHDVDWIMVVGVAGGVDLSVHIGGVVVPEAIYCRATGKTYHTHPIGDIVPRGTISCGNELMSDPEKVAQMRADGILAVEMESAAVAPVCEDAGIPWSVFRGISDFADEGLVDDELFAMTKPDGTSDPEVIKHYLEEHPEKVEVLMRLGKETNRATHAAAAAAIAACAAV
jgi:adenosylhomocysteine nucleosidase